MYFFYQRIVRCRQPYIALKIFVLTPFLYNNLDVEILTLVLSIIFLKYSNNLVVLSGIVYSLKSSKTSVGQHHLLTVRPLTDYTPERIFKISLHDFCMVADCLQSRLASASTSKATLKM